MAMWETLLAKDEPPFTYPWTGGRELRAQGRTLTLEGRAPVEHGWYAFRSKGGRTARWEVTVATAGEDGNESVAVLLEGLNTRRGYLVGDHFVPDDVKLTVREADIVRNLRAVHFVEPGLPRFARVAVSEWEDGRLLFAGREFDCGSEEEVRAAYEDRKSSVTAISGVTPALETAFRFDTFLRAQVEEQRIRATAEAEAQRQEEERALRAAELAATRAARTAEIAKTLGTGEGRRKLAETDFEAAARAALAVGGAEYLDSQPGYVRDERIVQFRFRNRRFECICNARTFRIIDAGVCLTDSRTGVHGDDRFTLESLPAVLAEAIRTHVLHVTRHTRGDTGHWERDDRDDDTDSGEDD